MQRRSFLQLAGLAAGGLFLGIFDTGCASVQVQRMHELAETTGQFSPNAFLTITPDNRVLLAMNKCEFGQGVFTGTATLVAEELEVPTERIEIIQVHKREFESSMGDGNIDTGGAIGIQITGGSSSTPENYVPVRKAAASAREMLVLAAAKTWNVPATECKAVDGFVQHSSGKKASYGELTKQAAKLDIVENPKLKEKAEFTRIGKRTQRVDAREKCTGEAIFGTDVQVEGKVCAYVIHPPKIGAQVQTLNAEKAKAMPGVLKVFSFERGVAVVAQKYWQARSAATQVEVTWTGGHLGALNTDALRQAAMKQAEQPGSHTSKHDGNAHAELQRDDVTKIEATYDFPYLAHATMEPMNCTVQITDDGAKIWAPNQSPSIMADAAAKYLGVSRNNIEVHSTLIGGGFGRRSVPDFVLEALMLAKHLDGKPVQIIWSRESDTRMGYYRPLCTAKARGTVDKQGKLTAVNLHVLSQNVIIDQSPLFDAIYADWIPIIIRKMMSRTTSSFLSTGAVADFLSTEGISDTPYAFPNYLLEVTPIQSNVPVAFWRSVGHSFTGFIMETFVDQLATAANKDSVEFRRALLAQSPRHLAVLNAAVAGSKWGQPIEKGWGRGVALHKSFGTYVAHVVEAGVVDGRISVRHVSSACDCGIVINPDVVKAQLESGIIFGLSAIKQRIDIVDGAVQQGNFDTYPAWRMYETPQIDITLIDSDHKPMGIGEPGLPPIAPAVSNAIFAATGVRLTSMPLQDAWDAHQAKTTP